jgi:hypothetical protein
MCIFWENVLGERTGRTYWENVLGERTGRTYWQNVLAERTGRTYWQNVRQTYSHGKPDGLSDHFEFQNLRPKLTQKVLNYFVKYKGFESILDFPEFIL